MLIDAVPDTIDAVYAFFVAAILALLLVPASEWIARRIGAIDMPNERSLHIAPTPKLGGLAILVGVLVAGILFLPMGDGLRGEQTRAILAGAVAIAAVGVIDDVFDLHAAVKLAGPDRRDDHPGLRGRDGRRTSRCRSSAASIRRASTSSARSTLGRRSPSSGIVAIVNIINLTDGVDGLAAGVCVISAATLAIIALSLDRNAAGVLAALTAGAALGFLRHGFPPASSFMGDTGSNLLGFLLGASRSREP